MERNVSITGELITVSLCRCDLSISAGSKQSASGNAILSLDGLKTRILVNETDQAWSLLHRTPGGVVDIVMDNAGYELFTDLCLADFLIAANVATTVRSLSSFFCIICVNRITVGDFSHFHFGFFFFFAKILEYFFAPLMEPGQRQD